MKEPVDVPLVVPTPDEERNGWTSESLGGYLQSRRTSLIPMADGSLMPVKNVSLPREANHRYNPKRWRR